ncbi:hypothetical protein [Actinomadura sp. KC345]|uniref:hypothetical protein n=1 Tax=Actinomadura sp. KC345 TaxID=2530371 RepID=UPI001FB59095|nr:hypothetical protein [Actinomadura sp. KC345]
MPAPADSPSPCPALTVASAPVNAAWSGCSAGNGTITRPASSPSGGARSRWRAAQARHVRMCLAIRLRHSGDGRPSQPASTGSSASQRRPPTARTMPRHVVSCFFIRCTRTAACGADSPSPSASSLRVRCPDASSHHSPSSSRSSGSSHRVASAISRRCSDSSSRRTAASAKSASAPATRAVSSGSSGVLPRCALQR